MRPWPLPRLVFVVACAPLALAACPLEQRLDEKAAAGSHNPKRPMPEEDPGGGEDPAPSDGEDAGVAAPGADAGGGGGAPGEDGPVAASCVDGRRRARQVLERNCAFCHQAPARMANFNFVLELDKLTTQQSSTGQRFVVPGDPEGSRLFLRVRASEMPPAGRMPRPSAADVEALRVWIAGCFDGSTVGWDPPPAIDGGAQGDAGRGEGGVPPPPGAPGGDCQTGNVCNAGGCCVLGQCRGNGETCGAGPLGDGVPGTCRDGSCVNEGVSCGGVMQKCCGTSVTTCTAPHAICVMGMTCQACGGMAQPCCGGGSCSMGLSCQGGGGGSGRLGTCQPCGGMGQPCCGTGVAAQKTCDAGLTCRFVVGMGDSCGK